ncbi:MAG: AAA family ATPase [Clostridia bacterium]|nr:AAA family ATPase [Clostridia bacterium]
MKLLSCYIENYGKISGETFTFNDGLTQLCKENGFGKTTLASFIKAMFYGLPSSRVNAKDFDDRQHFYPFNGGKFGGNLTFEMSGKTYKIERFFGKKSEKDDELKVYENGRETLTLGTEIGRVVFGLDEPSFSRTVFIGADEQEIVSTGVISAKLNNFVDATDDERGFERALDVLDKAKKRLKASRGNNDLSTRQKDKIFDLNTEIKNLEKISESLGELYTERERLRTDISALEEREKKANVENLLLQKWETYDGYLSAASEDSARLTQLKSAYPLGLPQKSETDDVFARLEESVAAKSRMETQAFSAEKTARLQTLDRAFSRGVPSEETLIILQSDIREIHTLDVELNGDTQQKTARDQTLCRTFENREPTIEQLEKARAGLERYRNADLQLQHAMQEKTTDKKSKAPLIAVAIAALFLVLGGVVLALGKLLGIAFLIAGVAGLVLALAGYLKGNNGKAVQDSTAQMKADRELATDAVRELLIPYGYYSANGVAYDFAVFEKDLEEYRTHKAAYAQTALEMEGKRAKRSARVAEVKNAFALYGLHGENLQENYTSLCAAVREYATLKKEYAQAKQTTEFAEKTLKENAAAILAVLQKYGLEKDGDLSAQFKRLERARDEILRLETSVKTAKERAENYRLTNGLTERATGEKTDIETLLKRVSELRAALAMTDRRITEAERQVERLPDTYNELATAEETLEEYRKKYALYDNTMKMLAQAEANLQNRYVAPIKERFLAYSSALERALGEKVSMDKDFRLRFERGGEERVDKHLSAGQKSLCGLCLRLALIDNMYESQQPFIVMDDPFLALDKAHMESTAILLRELAKKRQIIYFCCHESRSVVENEKSDGTV